MTSLMRRQEVSIRFALGARKSTIATLLLKSIAIEIAGGVLSGVAFVLLLGHLLAHFVAGATILQPAVFTAVLGLELTSAALVCAIPTIRIAFAKPFEALKVA
jgi:ABC-type antimicrobial peptide transport system permease subunit